MLTEIEKAEEEISRICLEMREVQREHEEIKKQFSRLQHKNPSTPSSEEVHFNDRLVYDEMIKRGIQLSFLPGTSILIAEYGNHTEILVGSIPRHISYSDAVILNDKYITKRLLKQRGFPVLEGEVFRGTEILEAQIYARSTLHYPVVVKATQGCGGAHVYCNICSDSDLRRAFSAISQSLNPGILVEKYGVGVDDFRFLFIRGKVRSVVKRTPPVIVGDGVSTLLELVRLENDRRSNPRVNCLCPIILDESCLKLQDVTPETIISKDIEIQCRFNSNVATGGECETVTESVHPAFIDIVEGIAALFPQIPLLAVDILTKDVRNTPETYWICECSGMNPGYSLHTHPSKGKPDDIISPLVDLIFPETAVI